MGFYITVWQRWCEIFWCFLIVVVGSYLVSWQLETKPTGQLGWGAGEPWGGARAQLWRQGPNYGGRGKLRLCTLYQVQVKVDRQVDKVDCTSKLDLIRHIIRTIHAKTSFAASLSLFISIFNSLISIVSLVVQSYSSFKM